MTTNTIYRHYSTLFTRHLSYNDIKVMYIMTENQQQSLILAILLYIFGIIAIGVSLYKYFFQKVSIVFLLVSLGCGLFTLIFGIYWHLSSKE